MKRILLFIAGLFTVISGFSQMNPGNIWVLGKNVKIDFSGGNAVAYNINNPDFDQGEGVANVCDASGNLLFYTDGVTVWDVNNTVIADNLDGHTSSTQSALIIPNPATWNANNGFYSEYYLFTVSSIEDGSNPFLSYYKLSWNGNNWTITESGNLLYNVSERIAGVRIAGKDSYWVVTHGYSTNSSDSNAKTFYAFLVSSYGLNTTPVTSYDASFVPNYYSYNGIRYGAQGYLKFSHDGTKLACAVSHQGVFVYDFNINTGEVSNQHTVITGTEYWYGVEFSPDNHLLYFSVQKSTPTANYGSKLYQYNLDNGNIYQTTINNDNLNQIGALQLAPDNKIYVAYFSYDYSTYTRRDVQYLGVIENPDIESFDNSSNCGFIETGLNLPLNTSSRMGLPNVINNDINLAPIKELVNNIDCKIKLFPNPVHNTLYLSIDNKEKYQNMLILVYSADGKIVRKEYLSSKTNTSINCETLQPGTYFIKIKSGNKILGYERFIKY